MVLVEEQPAKVRAAKVIIEKSLNCVFIGAYLHIFVS